MTDPITAASLRGAVDLSSLVQRGAPTAPSTEGDAPSPAAGLPSSLVIEATDTDFQRVLELSRTVPVIVDLWADWCQPCKQLTPILEKLVAEHAGRLVLATIDVDANPQLAQAFQAQSIPTVAAVIAGRPIGLFAGAYPEAQVREVFEQVLAAAEQNGVTGRIDVSGEGEPEADVEPEPEPLPPHHQEAYDAIDAGDYEAAAAAYRTAIAQDPRDALAVAGLAQVELLGRLSGADADALRRAAADAPDDAASQLAVADLDVSGGHVEDAFDRLLALFPRLAGDEREAVRRRLIDLFEIVGADDPRVGAARRRLAGLLY